MIFLLWWYFLLLKIGMFSLKREVDLTKPLPAWKRLIFVEAAQPVCRMLLVLLGFYNIKHVGDPSLYGPQGKANIITMNHVSHLDILIMMGVCYDGIPSFVAKRGVQNAPLIGYKSMVWQGLYVDNRAGAPGSSPSAGSSPQDGQHQSLAQKIAERGSNHDLNPVLIFPEGTTTNGKSIITFRTGAFISGNPVKPVAIHYPPGNFSPAWETVGALYHAIRLFSQFSNSCEIHWLPVYYPSDAEKKDPKLYAENVRKAIAKAINVPLIESSYQDKVDYHVSIGFSKPPKPQKEEPEDKKSKKKLE